MNLLSNVYSSCAFVRASLPNTGLGNKLFVWARALVFARLNALPLVVHGWMKPIGFRSGNLRFYGGSIRSAREVGFAHRLLLRCTAEVVAEPDFEGRPTWTTPTIFDFHRIPGWADYFAGLKPHRDLVRTELLASLQAPALASANAGEIPPICVHVRCGDFAILQPGQNFARVGGYRTPIEYFVCLVRELRQAHGSQLRTMVFTDGTTNDVRELLALPGVSIAPRAPAIVDLLRMARARILIPSAGSTFGYWAGFLGDCSLLLHPDHIHAPIRSETYNRRWYEGAAVGRSDRWPDLLRENIRQLPEDV